MNKYTAHIDRLTIPVHSPFWARTHKGSAAMITPQQYALAVKVFSGWRGNQRELAAATGYTVGGLNDAIRSLSGLGILVKSTRLGRHGWTRLKVAAGVHVGNVRERINDVLRTVSERTSLFANISLGGGNEAGRTTLRLPLTVHAGRSGPPSQRDLAETPGAVR